MQKISRLTRFARSNRSQVYIIVAHLPSACAIASLFGVRDDGFLKYDPETILGGGISDDAHLRRVLFLSREMLVFTTCFEGLVADHATVYTNSLFAVLNSRRMLSRKEAGGTVCPEFTSVQYDITTISTCIDAGTAAISL